MQTKKVTTPKEWCDEEHRVCFQAFKNVCRRSNDHDFMGKLSFRIAEFGAEATFNSAMDEARKDGFMIEPLNEVLLKACRHIEFKQRYE